MKNEKQTVQKSGIGFLGLLSIVFITLKLTGFVTWSWLWVLAPLWAPVMVFLIIFSIIILIAALTTE